jgi:hypothetical protein
MVDITKGLDGRKNAPPADPYPTKTNHRVTVAQVRTVIFGFESTGSTQHSDLRMFLPYIIEHCERNRIPYRLTAKPGLGYFIEKVKP